MAGFRSKRLWFLLLAGVVADTGAVACNVPVFRYALERWRSDAYQLVVVHKGPLGEADQAKVDALRQESFSESGHCNFELITTEWGDEKSQPYRSHISQAEAALPWVLLMQPAQRDKPSTIWSGPLKDADPARLLDSPGRKEIVKRLVGGESAVWILITSGNKKRDAQAAKLLADNIKILEQELQLPPGIGQPGSELFSEIPLRIDFSTLQILRDDPAERVLVDMLIAGQPSLAEEEGPLAFIAFGRARVLGGIGGDDLNEDLIMEASAMLCGPCSCQMKEMNPGYDLLARADWDSMITGELTGPHEMPPLKGFSDFVAAAPSDDGSSTNAAVVAQRPASPVAGSPGGGKLMRSVAAIVIAGLALLGAGSLLILRGRKPQRPQ